MNITITTPDGNTINTTKGAAMLDLRQYIRKNCPGADADIRAASLKIKEHKAAIAEIRALIAKTYGYNMPGF